MCTNGIKVWKWASTALLISVFVCLSLRATFAQAPQRDLDFFLSQGRSNSPLLKDLVNQRKALRIDSMIINAGAGPQLSATGAGLYAPIIQGIGYDEVITNGQSLEAYLNLNYDLLKKKRLKNQLEGVKIVSDSLGYEEKMSLYDLERSIVDQYLVAYASQEQLDFDKEVVTLLKQEEGILKQLTRKNIYKQSEYLAFLVTLQQQQVLREQSELQLQNDYAALASSSGLIDTSKIILKEPRLGYSQLLFKSDFFLQKFEFDSLRRSNLKQGIALNYKPRLGVYSNSGYSSSFMLQPYKNFGVSIGFSLTVPIYDGHQRSMQYEKLAILGNTVSAYKNFFITQRTQQLKLIQQQVSKTDSLFEHIKEQIRLSRGLIDVDSKLLHTGDLRVADYILAINNYMAAQNLLRQTTINRLKLINQYNYWNR